MGIISSQSSKKSIVNFLGVVIGAISIIFIYPHDKEIYGLALFLFSSANLLLILLSLGSHGLIIRFYPVFEQKKIMGFLGAILSIVTIAIIISSGILLLLKPGFYSLLEKLQFKVDLIKDYQRIIYGLTIILIFIMVFINHASNLKRIVVPSILYELMYKIALPILVLLSFYSILDQQAFLNAYLLFFLLILIALIFYVWSIGGLKMLGSSSIFLNVRLRKDMLIYMLYSGLNQIGAGIVSRIDAIMIATMISLTDTGIYGILLFMANAIEIPVRSINQIAAPVISSSLTNNDLKNVATIYKKSSINALLFGIFIFVGIWSVLYNLFDLMPDNKDFYLYKNVFLFLGLGKMVDMAFSTNSHMLIYSKFYKYNLAFVLFLGLTNLFLNYYLIGLYQLEGAAMATAISLILYNIIKLFFIRLKFSMWPFSGETLKVIIIGIICFFAGSLLPDLFMNWIDILIKSVLISLLYYLSLKLFKVKAEIIDEFERIFLNIVNSILKK